MRKDDSFIILKGYRTKRQRYEKKGDNKYLISKSKNIQKDKNSLKSKELMRNVNLIKVYNNSHIDSDRSFEI